MPVSIAAIPAKVLDAKLSLGWAYAFCRPEAVAGLGHSGWGFKTADNHFVFGGTENPMSDKGPLWGLWGSWHQGTAAQGGDNSAWVGYGQITDMYAAMKGKGYDRYKGISVAHPNVHSAYNMAVTNTRAGFTGLTNNCLDATYRVLTKYNAQGLPWPATNWTPNGWFNMVKAACYAT